MNGNLNGYYGNQNHFNNVMNQQDFSNLVKAVKRDARNDDTKMIMISSATQFSRFTSGQIYELMKVLNFESNKLKLAKQLFSICADKQNFYQVYAAFNFESSKLELNEYVLRN
jgi:hypothetical protein